MFRLKVQLWLRVWYKNPGKKKKKFFRYSDQAKEGKNRILLSECVTTEWALDLNLKFTKGHQIPPTSLFPYNIRMFPGKHLLPFPPPERKKKKKARRFVRISIAKHLHSSLNIGHGFSPTFNRGVVNPTQKAYSTVNKKVFRGSILTLKTKIIKILFISGKILFRASWKRQRERERGVLERQLKGRVLFRLKNNDYTFVYILKREWKRITNDV